MIVDDESINKGGTKNMIRSIETFCVDGEKFIDYYSENDFEYTVHVGKSAKS